MSNSARMKHVCNVAMLAHMLRLRTELAEGEFIAQCIRLKISNDIHEKIQQMDDNVKTELSQYLTSATTSLINGTPISQDSKCTVNLESALYDLLANISAETAMQLHSIVANMLGTNAIITAFILTVAPKVPSRTVPYGEISALYNNLIANARKKSEPGRVVLKRAAIPITASAEPPRSFTRMALPMPPSPMPIEVAQPEAKKVRNGGSEFFTGEMNDEAFEYVCNLEGEQQAFSGVFAKHCLFLHGRVYLPYASKCACTIAGCDLYGSVMPMTQNDVAGMQTTIASGCYYIVPLEDLFHAGGIIGFASQKRDYPRVRFEMP